MSPDLLTPHLSIVVPALREALNLPVLAGRLDAALPPGTWELLIVDDNSKDGTDTVCAKLAETLPVRLLVRNPPKDGLSGAVLDGFQLARGEILLVMDADLQHPPEKVPDLVTALETLGAGGFALGSRYTAGGAIDGNWSPFRAVNSRMATLLARPFAPGITDPMSGFFALHRSTYLAAERLTPLGYKIALELICKCNVAASRGGRGVVEVPITFAQRTLGHSKLSAREQFRYLEHLSRLYDYTFPRASPIAKFLISVILGVVPAAGLFSALGPSPTNLAGAYVVGLGVIALLHYRYVNAQREFLPRPTPWRDFGFIAIAELAVLTLTAVYLTHRIPTLPKSELFLIPVLLATLTRYALRKELLQDLRGLGKDIRNESIRREM